LWGIFIIVGYRVRVLTSRNEQHFVAFKNAIRQSFFISLGMIGVLGLSVMKMLAWWDTMILIVIIFLLDLYFRKGVS